MNLLWLLVLKVLHKHGVQIWICVKTIKNASLQSSSCLEGSHFSWLFGPGSVGLAAGVIGASGFFKCNLSSDMIFLLPVNAVSTCDELIWNSHFRHSKPKTAWVRWCPWRKTCPKGAFLTNLWAWVLVQCADLLSRTLVACVDMLLLNPVPFVQGLPVLSRDVFIFTATISPKQEAW